MRHWMWMILAAMILVARAPRALASAATQPASPGDGDANVPTLRPAAFDDDDDEDEKKPAVTTNSAAAPAGERYFFGLLDNRSRYGQDFFHDPFIGPEFDSERQFEVDYAHSENHGSQEDEVDAELEYTVAGRLTLAAELGWDSHRQSAPLIGRGGDDDDRGGGTGLESIDLGAYHPIYQFVSDDDLVDYTAALRLDVGIPTRTPASGGEATLTPYLGHLLRLGDHISVEAWTGWQFTIGPNQPTDFIYGASVGYLLRHRQLPIPLTESITPIFELDGQSPMSGPGPDALLGVAGFELEGRDFGDVQPQLQLGYEFPLDQGGRDELRWGILAQFYIQF